MRFDLSDQLVGRMTAGKVLARPNPSQLAFRRSLDAVGLTGSRGNPDLQPFEATQYDLGVEWYFSEDGFVSLTAFRKEISSFVSRTRRRLKTPMARPATTQRRREHLHACRGQSTAPDDVTINGIEAGAQYAFDFLPQPFNGFGALANITYQKDEGFKGSRPDHRRDTALPRPVTAQLQLLAVLRERAVQRARLLQLARALAGHGIGSRQRCPNSPKTSARWTRRSASPSFRTSRCSLRRSTCSTRTASRTTTPFRRIGNETYGSRFFAGIRAKL